MCTQNVNLLQASELQNNFFLRSLSTLYNFSWLKENFSFQPKTPLTRLKMKHYAWVKFYF